VKIVINLQALPVGAAWGAVAVVGVAVIWALVVGREGGVCYCVLVASVVVSVWGLC